MGYYVLTEQSIIFLVFLGAFLPPFVLNSMLGVEGVPVNYINGALSLGSKPNDVFRHVILPGALPSVFTGMTVGMGLTWVMVVAAEMVAGGYGLGYMTWESYSYYLPANYPGYVCHWISGLSVQYYCPCHRHANDAVAQAFF